MSREESANRLETGRKRLRYQDPEATREAAFRVFNPAASLPLSFAISFSLILGTVVAAFLQQTMTHLK